MIKVIKLIEKAKLWYFLLPLGGVFLFTVTSTGSTSSTALEPSYSQSLTATAVGYEIAAHYSHALPTQAAAHKLTPTPTNTPTSTPTDTPTATDTATPTPTPSNTPTATPTLTPSSTPFPTETPPPTLTNTPSPTPTASPAPTRVPFAVQFGGGVDLGAVAASPIFLFPSVGAIGVGLALYWYAGRMGNPHTNPNNRHPSPARPSPAGVAAKAVGGMAHVGVGVLRVAPGLLQPSPSPVVMAHAGTAPNGATRPTLPRTNGRRPPNTPIIAPTSQRAQLPPPPSRPAAVCGKYPKATPRPASSTELTRPITKRPGEHGTERIGRLIEESKQRRESNRPYIPSPTCSSVTIPANNGCPDTAGHVRRCPDVSGLASGHPHTGVGEGLIVVHSVFLIEKVSAMVGTITYDGESWAWPMHLPLSPKQETFLYALYLKEQSIGRTCTAAFALSGNGSEAAKVTRQIINYYKELSANERVVLN